MVNRASHTMTGDLVDLWEQRETRVDFDIDGNYMRLWVTDNVDGSRIELEERSKGFQWFFSFYIIFNVESEKGHKNAILLLDEPGLHLHASAQADLIKVLRKLSKENQLIYTTHSPFMIDMDHLDTVRTVTETKNGSIISTEAWSTDKEAMFPLQAALGYSMSQSLFISKNNLVVEGITDFWYLSALGTIMRDNGRDHIDEKITITPAGGAHKTTLLCAMLSGQKLNVGVLLDADHEGKMARDDIVKNKIVRDSKVICINEIIDGKMEMDFEDIFPEEFYVDYVNRSYEKELGDDQLSCPLPGHKPRINQKIEDILQEKSIKYYKSRPARLMLEDFKNIKIDDLPKILIENYEKLSNIINERMKVK